MARFIPTRDGRMLLNVDRVDYFRIVEMPDTKWVTDAVLGEHRHTSVATHSTLDDARDALATLLDRNGVLGG
jgi:hypothetical protein